MSVWSKLLRENRFRPDDVPAFQRQLFYADERRRRTWSGSSSCCC